MVLGPEQFRDFPGMRKFVCRIVSLVAHGKGLDPLTAHPAHDGCDGAGVQPPAQKDPQRHLAHKAHLDGLPQQFPEFFKGTRKCKVGRHNPVEFPVGVCLYVSIRTNSHGMAWHEFQDAFEHGSGAWRVSQGQEGVKCGFLEIAADQGRGQDGPYLGGKHKVLMARIIIEGFDAHAIAGKEQNFAGLVPDGKGEHASQTIHTPLTPLTEGCKEYLRIGCGAESVSQTFQFPAERQVVINLSIINNHLQ